VIFTFMSHTLVLGVCDIKNDGLQGFFFGDL